MKVSVAGGQLALQALDLTIPAGQDVRGLTFVLRSADSSRWWRDGAPSSCRPCWHSREHLETSVQLCTGCPRMQ